MNSLGPRQGPLLAGGFVNAGIRVGDEAARLGITTLCDQATGGLAGMGDLDFYKQMFESGRMHARIRASLKTGRLHSWDRLFLLAK